MDDKPRHMVQHYQAVHRWVYRNYGKANHCESCDKPEANYQWANISGKYLRDIADWKQLCISCHKLMDFTESARKNLSLSHSSGINGIKAVNESGEKKMFSALYEAAKETGISKTAINNCLMGRTKTSGTYRWSYV